jgi:trk system potassium uptake protein TrkA
MNIVVIGMGKLGRLLAKHLSEENHDVTAIDTKNQVLEDVINQFDVKGVCGNGACLDIQKNAQVGKADLLIAATSNDEVNVLCCLVAKKLGVSQTIARIRKPEYAKQMSIMGNELGISMMVNPEFDAANEISRIIGLPAAIKVEPFANGKVNLVEIKIDHTSPLAGRNLFSIRNHYQIKLLVCAVKRNDEVIIPKGDFTLQENDNVYITASSSEMMKIFKKLSLYKERIKTAMIIGGGRIAYYLVQQLLDFGIDVKIIDKDSATCDSLCVALPKALIIHGDATNKKILLEEGIDTVDSLITLTGFDETNIIISSFAKAMNCKKIITKVNSSDYGDILNNIGLDCVISPKEISSTNIIRYVRGMEQGRGSEFKTLYRLVDNRVEAIEFYISQKTDYTSIPLKDLAIKDGNLIACIIRENKVIIPSGLDTIEPFDSIIVVTIQSSICDVTDILK